MKAGSKEGKNNKRLFLLFLPSLPFLLPLLIVKKRPSKEFDKLYATVISLLR